MIRRGIQNGFSSKRVAGLRMWANARQGNIVALAETLGAEPTRFMLLLYKARQESG